MKISDISLKPTESVVTKVYIQPQGVEEMKICSNRQITSPVWPPCPYKVKALKIFLSRTNRPIAMKLNMEHRVLDYYQEYINDDLQLTLTFLRKVKYGKMPQHKISFKI